jgi:hypothetical protein
MADQAEDEAAVRKVALQILDGYSAGTPEKMAELFAEDWENWEGTIKGRTAWKQYATEVLQRRKGVKFKQLEEIGIVFVTPDVAIYKQIVEASGGVDEGGKPLPPAKILYAVVFVKKGGNWLQSTYFGRTIEE